MATYLSEGRKDKTGHFHPTPVSRVRRGFSVGTGGRCDVVSDAPCRGQNKLLAELDAVAHQPSKPLGFTVRVRKAGKPL